MCGVFGVSNYANFDFEERFNYKLDEKEADINFSGLFRPHTFIPTVSKNSPNKLVMRYWSVIPPWIEDINDLKFPTFNARSETVREKPTFKYAWKKAQRCLVLVTEFYEFRDNGKGKRKTPFKFLINSEPFALAGLYQAWKDFETVTILTSDANTSSESIHNRLPVIIPKSYEEKWLNKDTSLEEAYAMLKPAPVDLLEIHEELALKKSS